MSNKSKCKCGEQINPILGCYPDECAVCPVATKLGYHVIAQQDIDFAHQTVTKEIIARKLSGYDEVTWSKLREDRKRTYRRAADMLICQWAEFVSLFERRQ